jgi:hypothetical protein
MRHLLPKQKRQRKKLQQRKRRLQRLRLPRRKPLLRLLRRKPLLRLPRRKPLLRPSQKHLRQPKLKQRMLSLLQPSDRYTFIN